MTSVNVNIFFKTNLLNYKIEIEIASQLRYCRRLLSIDTAYNQAVAKSPDLNTNRYFKNRPKCLNEESIFDNAT